MLYVFSYQHIDGPHYLYGAASFEEAYEYWKEERIGDSALVVSIEDNDDAPGCIKIIHYANLSIRVREYDFMSGAIGSFIY